MFHRAFALGINGVSYDPRIRALGCRALSVVPGRVPYAEGAIMHAKSPTNPPARLCRISEAASELTLSTRSVWRLIKLGELTVVRCGRATRIERGSIDRFIARGGTAQ